MSKTKIAAIKCIVVFMIGFCLRSVGFPMAAINLAEPKDGDDVGKIVGRNGRTIRAIRNLVSSAGGRAGYKAMVEIVD